MTEDDDIRAWFRDKHDGIMRDAHRAKAPNLARPLIIELYDVLSEKERRDVNKELVEWALRDDPMGVDGVASDRGHTALMLIDEFQVTEALPALRVLQERYEHSNIPAAPSSWARVNGIIGRLTSGEGPTIR